MKPEHKEALEEILENNVTDAYTKTMTNTPELLPDEETNNCACKFENDECVDVCAYHYDLADNYKKLIEQYETLRTAKAKLWNENLALKRLQAQNAALREALEGCIEHMEWSTLKGQQAYHTAIAALKDGAV